MANAKAAVKPASGGNGIGGYLPGWLSRNRYYIIAFFIPVVLMYISYVIFGIEPFGDKSVLCLDLNAQYVYYFEALRDAFWGDGSIFYNWARNLSGGMMGIIGYYLASPFTLIVMLLPRKMILTSLLIMILCKIGTASVTFSYYLQKSKGLEPLHATMFAVLYSLMAYMVIQTIDPMWLDGLVLLPLVALGIEYLVDDGRKLNYIIPAALIFVANFYIGYMIGLFSAVYFIYYLFFGKDGGRGRIRNYLYTGCTFGIATLVALMLAAFMLLPVYNALKLGKFDFSGEPDRSFAMQFEPVTILAQLLTAQYDSVNVQGSPEIYCGILTVVLLPLFFLNKKLSLRCKLGYGFLMAVMFFSMCIRPVDMQWHGGQMPNWLPFRYSFIVSFILLSMAAQAWKHLDGVEARHLGGVFFGEMAVILFIHSQGYEHLDIMKSIWLSIGLAGAYLLFLYAYKLHQRKILIPVLMMCVMSAELVFNSVLTLKSIDKEVLYSSGASYDSVIENGRKAVDVMESLDSGLYRSEKTFSRCINDNMAYGLKGLTHSSSVMNARILTFIETLGFNSRSYYTRYDGTTEIGDSLLGIKYVLDQDGNATPQAGDDLERVDSRKRSLLHSTYPKVGEYSYTGKNSDGSDKPPTTIGIYQNPNALSIGYMVSSDLKKIDHLGNDNPFNSQNMLLSTMTGQTVFGADGGFDGWAEYYRRIDVGEPVLGAVTVSDYNGQACYTKKPEGDPTVDYRFTVDSDEEVLFFLKTENEQAVNLWLGIYDEATGNYRFGSSGFGQYFETHNYSILSMGHFTPGTKVALRMTVLDKDNATIVKEPFFYYFNRDKYQEDIDKLKGGQMEITKFSADSLEGTVTAGENQDLFTSIPYEPGWTVYVDGQKAFTTGSSDYTESVNADGQKVRSYDAHQMLKAMIYVPLEAGQHTIRMKYTPPGFVAGVLLFVVGTAMCVMFGMYDSRSNKVLLALANSRKADAAQREREKKAAARAQRKAESAPAASDADEDEEEQTAEDFDAPADGLPDSGTPEN
ncbi:MAG: YfhO family protein [Oscillospiraceae bacterium]|nr:YfhO family protein [Oscillospiraceae bacterium]